jgi:hypothetical protein
MGHEHQGGHSHQAVQILRDGSENQAEEWNAKMNQYQYDCEDFPSGRATVGKPGDLVRQISRPSDDVFHEGDVSPEAGKPEQQIGEIVPDFDGQRAAKRLAR